MINALRGLEPDVTMNHLKHLTLAVSVAAALSACKKAEPVAAPVAAAPEAPAPLVIDQSKLPPVLRFGVADLDPSQGACTDLHSFVNAKWLAANPVPADKTTWGTFEVLGERTLAVQKQIVEAAATSRNAAGSNEQKVGDIYGVGMDEARLNADGAAPLKPFLAQIDALADAPGIAAYLTDSFSKGNQYVFSFGPEADFKDARNVIGYAFQGGLSLPEKAYYLEPQYQDKRDAFLGHVERMLVLAGIDAASAKAQAQAVLAFETRLANASLARVELRNPANQYHFVSVDEADKLTPNFSWSKLLAAEGVTGVKGFSLSQPKFFAEMDKMLADVSRSPTGRPTCATTRWTTPRVYLSDALSNERFDFYGKTMRGQKEQKPRWKRVLDTINGTMGEALGQIYVQQVFPAESKAQMLQLVANLRDALKARLEKLDWMSAETKAKALAKWNTFTPKIGYPDKWRDYSGLTIDRGKSYFDNVLAASAFDNACQMAKIGKPVDRKEWGMTPQTVNAYYNPLRTRSCSRPRSCSRRSSIPKPTRR